MRRWLVLALLPLLAASCGDREVGRRYRAERDLWGAYWEQRSLGIRPADVGRERWNALADRFEAIGEEYGARDASNASSAAHREIRVIAARALFAAAQVRASMGDSARVDELYERLSSRFADLPDVASEIALAHGILAERRRQFTQAADLYASVVGRIPPKPDGQGAEALVLTLPIRIARLRSAAAATGRPVPTEYAAAESYYQRLLTDPAIDPRLKIETLGQMAQLATDQRRWSRTIALLREVETELRAMDQPPREPCEVRFAISSVQRQAGTDPDSIRATLASLLDDYPQCTVASQALLALAENAAGSGNDEEALGYLDRVLTEHGEDVGAGSQALLGRARLLEHAERWAEALDAYHNIAVRYPLSEPALQAPLEIAAHYQRAGDQAGTDAALAKAEEDYRTFIERYPPSGMTATARERLAQTLVLEKKYDQAVGEMVSLGDDYARTSRGAMVLLAAGQIAADQLGDSTRAADIFEHIGQLYPETDIGRQAAEFAASLRSAAAK